MHRRSVRDTFIALGAAATIITALLGTASPARAAFSAERCFAAKIRAWGTVRKCERDEAARTVLGKTSNPARCQRTFTATLTRIEAKATAAGIVCRFRDNGDGTVTDFQTGLMWARLAGLNGVPSTDVLDPDNAYDWHEAHSAAASLNGRSTNGGLPAPLPGFPLYSDWRLPTITELRSIVDCAFVGYCFRPETGPTDNGMYYWSSSGDAGSNGHAWRVVGSNGQVGVSSTNATLAIRPVRNAF